MARPTSPERLSKVKRAVMSHIATHGYSGATITTIAKAAEVSEGYLYRFYPTKESMVQAIYEEEVGVYHEFIIQALDKNQSAKEVINSIVGYLFKLVSERPESFRFLDVMLHDPTFIFPKSRLETIRKISVKLTEKGIVNKEFDPKWQAEDIFVLLFSVPFKFLDSRIRGLFQKKSISKNDQSQLTELLFSALGTKK